MEVFKKITSPIKKLFSSEPKEPDAPRKLNAFQARLILEARRRDGVRRIQEIKKENK